MPNFCGYPDGPCSLWHDGHKAHAGDKEAFKPEADIAYIVLGQPDNLGRQEVHVVWEIRDRPHWQVQRLRVAEFVTIARMGIMLTEPRRVVQAQDDDHALALIGFEGWKKGENRGRK